MNKTLLQLLAEYEASIDNSPSLRDLLTRPEWLAIRSKAQELAANERPKK